MQNKKPIRRYTIAKRAAMRAGYVTRKGMRVPVGISLFFCSIVTGLLMVGFFFGSVALLIQIAQGTSDFLPWFFGAVVCAFATISLIYIERLCVRELVAVINAPRGTFLNPLPPNPNEILPENEVLVRASSSNQTGVTLLRAATSQPDNAPETLLRATTVSKIE